MAYNTPVRMAALGAAAITPSALLRPAHALRSAEVVAVAARHPAKARRFASRHAIAHVHETYGALLADPEIDAVYIALPNSLHAEWTLKALKAGKHVLCEKPLTANADEAARVAKAAAHAGLVLMEAYHYRYHPLAERIKAVIELGELGNIRHLEVHFCLPLLLPGNIRYRYDLGGGATMDLGCYAINLIRYLTGSEPTVVRARAHLAAPNVDRLMEADLMLGDNCSARLVCSLLSRTLLSCYVVVRGDEGDLHVTNPFSPHLYHRFVVRHHERRRHERFPAVPTYTYQLQAFVSAVRHGTPVPTHAADAVATMKVIDAIYTKAGLKRRGAE